MVEHLIYLTVSNLNNLSDMTTLTGEFSTKVTVPLELEKVVPSDFDAVVVDIAHDGTPG